MFTCSCIWWIGIEFLFIKATKKKAIMKRKSIHSLDFQRRRATAEITTQTQNQQILALDSHFSIQVPDLYRCILVRSCRSIWLRASKSPLTNQIINSIDVIDVIEFDWCCVIMNCQNFSFVLPESLSKKAKRKNWIVFYAIMHINPSHALNVILRTAYTNHLRNILYRHAA